MFDICAANKSVKLKPKYKILVLPIGILPYKRPRHEHKYKDESRIEDFSFLLLAVVVLLMPSNMRQRWFSLEAKLLFLDLCLFGLRR